MSVGCRIPIVIMLMLALQWQFTWASGEAAKATVSASSHHMRTSWSQQLEWEKYLTIKWEASLDFRFHDVGKPISPRSDFRIHVQGSPFFSLPLVIGDITDDTRIRPLIEPDMERQQRISRFGDPLQGSVTTVQDSAFALTLLRTERQAIHLFFKTPGSDDGGEAFSGVVCELAGQDMLLHVAASAIGQRARPMPKWMYDHLLLPITNGSVGYVSCTKGTRTSSRRFHLDTSMLFRFAWDRWHGFAFGSLAELECSGRSWRMTVKVSRNSPYAGHIRTGKVVPMRSRHATLDFLLPSATISLRYGDALYRPGVYAGTSQRRVTEYEFVARTRITGATLAMGVTKKVEWTPRGEFASSWESVMSCQASIGPVALRLEPCMTWSGDITCGGSFDLDVPMDRKVWYGITFSHKAGKTLLTLRWTWVLPAGSIHVAFDGEGGCKVTYSIAR